MVTKALKKEHQDFIEGKQEVNKFMEELRTVINSLHLELIRQVQMIHHYSKENLVVEGSDQHFILVFVDYKPAF